MKISNLEQGGLLFSTSCNLYWRFCVRYPEGLPLKQVTSSYFCVVVIYDKY